MKGYKTYLTAGLLELLTVANTLGWVDAAIYEALVGLLASFGLYAIRAAIGSGSA